MCDEMCLIVQNIHGPADGIQKAFSSHELAHILCFLFKWLIWFAFLSNVHGTNDIQKGIFFSWTGLHFMSSF